MMIKNAGTKDNIHHPDAVDCIGMTGIAEYEFNAGISLLFLCLKLRCRTKNIDTFDNRRAGFLSNKGMFAVNAPHTTDINKTATGHVMSNVFGELIICADTPTASDLPMTP